MKRRVSQSLSKEYEQAIKDGYVTKCIGRKCVCWTFCSNNGKSSLPGCTSDLSTGFYRNMNLDYDPYPSVPYRDPFIK